MTSLSPAVKFQQFDTDAFGVPFYRVTNWRSTDLKSDISMLVGAPPVIVDAKLPAEDIETSACLTKLGFSKVCTQIELFHALDGPQRAPERSKIRATVVFPEAVIRAHVAHFAFDRFALDINLPAGGHDTLYERWMRNSLEGGRCSIALRENNFITFRDAPASVKIDLVSVLDKGRGIATDLLNAILCHARERKARHVEVVTECENLPAVRLYLKAGFKPSRFYSVFHFVRFRAN